MPEWVVPTLSALSWIFGTSQAVLLFTPLADVYDDVDALKPLFNQSYPYSGAIRTIGFCFIFSMAALTLITYLIIFGYILHQFKTHKLHASGFKEKQILFQSVIKFSGDLLVNVFYNFDIFEPTPVVNFCVTVGYILNTILIPTIFYISSSVIRQQLIQDFFGVVGQGSGKVHQAAPQSRTVVVRNL
ncbi:hypothetical protein L596_026088 [Steinernema carpocapsae]|uniref:7TM GPCR serpentine receptor class x (Srx) domain-containing protein n=1 Tax=Steinernema carpocapsae TaxID=34508 RepID=A0A4U5M0B6_STECR|nr:hypothetical protein L596_026088 [Steinernema carpocapsae]